MRVRVVARVRVRVVPQRYSVYYFPHAEFPHITHSQLFRAWLPDDLQHNQLAERLSSELNSSQTCRLAGIQSTCQTLNLSLANI